MLKTARNELKKTFRETVECGQCDREIEISRESAGDVWNLPNICQARAFAAIKEDTVVTWGASEFGGGDVPLENPRLFLQQRCFSAKENNFSCNVAGSRYFPGPFRALRPSQSR